MPTEITITTHKLKDADTNLLITNSNDYSKMNAKILVNKQFMRNILLSFFFISSWELYTIMYNCG